MKFHFSPRKLDTKHCFRKTALKKELNSRLNTSSSYPSTIMKFLEIIFVKYMYIDRRAFYLTDVKLAYTSTHTNKSFLSLVSIKSFESSQLFLNLVQNFEKPVTTQKMMWLDVSRNVRFTLKI